LSITSLMHRYQCSHFLRSQVISFFLSGATEQNGLFVKTSTGPLCGDPHITVLSVTNTRTAYIRASSGIRTHSSRARVSEDPTRLRPLGHTVLPIYQTSQRHTSESWYSPSVATTGICIVVSLLFNDANIPRV
jgi:hypothetical protein